MMSLRRQARTIFTIAFWSELFPSCERRAQTPM